MNRLMLIMGVVLCVTAAVLFVTGIVVAVRGGEDQQSIVLVSLITAAVIEPIGLILLIRGLQAASAEGAGGARDDGGPEVYRDRLLSIYEHGINLRMYYFPWGDRFVPFASIKYVDCLQPGRLGCWRQWGTGDFRTWFPLDWSRPWRTMIFVIHLDGRWGRIGFTAENSELVHDILAEKVDLFERED